MTDTPVGKSSLRFHAERLRLSAQNIEFKGYDAAHEIVPDMREDVRAWLENYAE